MSMEEPTTDDQGPSLSTNLLPRHLRPNLAPRQPRRNFLPSFPTVDVLDQLARRIKHQRISAFQNRQWRQRLQRRLQPLASHLVYQQRIPHRRHQCPGSGGQLFPHSTQHQPQVVMANRRRSRLPPPPHLVQQPPFCPFHPVSKVVNFLLPLIDYFHDARKRAVLRHFRQCLTSHQQAVAHCTRQPLLQGRRMIFHFLPRPNYQLRRGGGRRRPQIGHEIQNRKICLVTHRRNHRNPRRRNRPRQPFIVERRQIFRRSAAARHHNHIHIFPLIKNPHARSDFSRRGVTLHLCRIDQHAHRVVPTPQNIQNVAQCRGLRRRYHANSRRQRRNRFFALCRKQSFVLQLRLKLLERQLQRARALGLNKFRRNLKLAAVFVHRHAPAHQRLQSIRRTKTQQPSRGAEHHHANLRIPILQREIKVPRIRRAKI